MLEKHLLKGNVWAEAGSWAAAYGGVLGEGMQGWFQARSRGVNRQPCRLLPIVLCFQPVGCDELDDFREQ